MRKVIYITFAICLCLLAGRKSQAADFGDVQIGGFVSQGYLQTDHNNYLAEDNKRGSLEFNEMGINFQTYPTDKVMVGLQLSARDLGDVGNDEIDISWAFGEYSWREWLGLRAGILKLPVGLYNETRDYDFLRTSILLPQSVYNEWMRDGINNIKGVQFFGNIDLQKAGLLKYQIMGGNLPMSTDSGAAYFIRRSVTYIDSIDSIDIDRLYHGQIIWVTPIDGLRLAYSFTYFDESVTTFSFSPAPGLQMTQTLTYEENKNHFYSIEYTFKNLMLSAEYFSTTYDIKETMSDYESGDRYYINASYRFTKWFESGLYYAKYESRKNIDLPTNELNDICLSLRFDLNESWIAKCEAHRMDGLFGVFPEDDGTLDESWMLYAAKLSYSF